jgi:hypothetical protein
VAPAFTLTLVTRPPTRKLNSDSLEVLTTPDIWRLLALLASEITRVLTARTGGGADSSVVLLHANMVSINNMQNSNLDKCQPYRWDSKWFLSMFCSVSNYTTIF